MQHKSSHEKTPSAKLTIVVLSDAEKSSRTFKISRLKLTLIILFGFVALGAMSVLAMIDTPLGELIMPEYFSTQTTQLQKVKTLESKIDGIQTQLSYLVEYNSKLRSILGDTMTVDTAAFEAAGNVQAGQNAEQPVKLSQVQSEISDKQAFDNGHSSAASAPENQQRETADTYVQSPPNENDQIIFPLLMPVAGFITRNVDYSIQHYGLDISAPKGESIVSPAPGEVVFEDWTLTGGNTLIIAHPNDFMTVYKHCERILVSVGTKVSRGEAIALVGSTGITSTGPHLHFELWQNGKNLNPENYLLTKN